MEKFKKVLKDENINKEFLQKILQINTQNKYIQKNEEYMIENIIQIIEEYEK